MTRELNRLSTTNPNNPLTEKQTVQINTILADFGEPPLPYGTLRKVALVKLKEIKESKDFRGERKESLRKFQKKFKDRFAANADKIRHRNKLEKVAKEAPTTRLTPVPRKETGDYKQSQQGPFNEDFDRSKPKTPRAKRALFSPDTFRTKGSSKQKTPNTRNAKKTPVNMPTMGFQSPRTPFGVTPNRVQQVDPQHLFHQIVVAEVIHHQDVEVEVVLTIHQHCLHLML